MAQPTYLRLVHSKQDERIKGLNRAEDILESIIDVANRSYKLCYDQSFSSEVRISPNGDFSYDDCLDYKTFNYDDAEE
ncbi:MAG: hypothetical protein Q8Q35_03260 [Nanoarchaeota archaeon]|nr:hypothetical protein [Nanoarchaeota archaeon]